MASTLIVLTCAVADGFLFYVLVQFARELKKGRIARAVSPVIPVFAPEDDKAAKVCLHPKVIDIIVGSRELSQKPSQRRAS